MNAVLIDAKNRNIRLIDLRDFHEIYSHLDCETFDMFQVDDLDVYVDDEGLYNSSYGFVMQGAHQPIAGNAVVLGSPAPDGDSSVSVPCTADDIKKMVQFIQFSGKASA